MYLHKVLNDCRNEHQAKLTVKLQKHKKRINNNYEPQKNNKQRQL